MRDLISPVTKRLIRDKELLETRVKEQLDTLAEKEGIYFDGDFFIGEGQAVVNELTEALEEAINILRDLGVTIERNDEPSIWERVYTQEL